MIVLHIDEPIPSLNKTMGYWTRQMKHRRRWQWLTRAAILRAQIFVPPRWQKARIRIERYGARILDTDNLRGGAKALIDALKYEEIIADDSPANIGEPEIRQFVSSTERRTVVYVEAA